LRRSIHLSDLCSAIASQFAQSEAKNCTLTSFAFSLRKNEDGLSTDLERFADVNPSIQDKTKFRLAKINAGLIRNNINDGLDCIHNPLPENYAHSLIVNKSGRISDSKSRTMAKNAIICL
jgi:hypothetical protein